MSLDVNIHAAQTTILRSLLFLPKASYTDLQKPTGLSSDHFSFHIARLVELGLVEKTARGIYRLSSHGKEYANRLDTDNNTLERQPKSAVIIGLLREINGEKQYLFQQRLKNPYYGFWGLPSGKIRWGETITEAAARESLEETGLQANFSVRSVYHEHVREKETGLIMEDKLFFIVLGENVSGRLVADFEGGHNEWLSVTAALGHKKKYATLKAEVDMLTTSEWLFEQSTEYSNEDF